MTPEQEIRADHLARAQQLVDSFQQNRAKYATLFPLKDDLERLQGEEGDLAYGFVKKFELMVESVNRRLVRSVAVQHGISIQSAKLADLTAWAASIGLLPNPDRWAEITGIRNVLAHEYLIPLAAYRPVGNNAWLAVDEIIATITAIEQFVADHRLLENREG